MNRMKIVFFLLPAGIFSLSGCYTQFATVQEEESYYQAPQDDTGYQDSTYESDNAYYDDYDRWQSHSYIGFSFYYPRFYSSYWGLDWCYYPSYWDIWWGPALYPYYSYYPYHTYWDWYGYPFHGYYSNSYGHYYYSRPYATRNFGYQRGGNTREVYGADRRGRTGGPAAVSGTRVTSGRRSSVSAPALRSGRGNSGQRASSATGRRSGRSAISPPRISTSRTPRAVNKQGAVKSGRQARSESREGYSGGNTNRQSGYSQPQQRTSPAPSAPSRSGGSERSSSGSGRGRR